jgi:hypothetical protein
MTRIQQRNSNPEILWVERLVAASQGTICRGASAPRFSASLDRYSSCAALSMTQRGIKFVLKRGLEFVLIRVHSWLNSHHNLII